MLHKAPLKRLIIANRGEIACRIALTAQRLGITTLAVYSDADRGARHVRMADEAYYLGPAAAAQSYLDISKILTLAQRVGADCVHPGYGFLSENAAFAQACVDAGLVFIGPPAAAIMAMGSKSASKHAMAAVGVPVAPGYHGDDQSLERFRAEAQRVGFPLIIKASAGGGGKGMQVVRSESEVPVAVESAKRLARTAFADDRLLLERYFPKARHVELQVFADSSGNIVTLLDRDCSVQRRHQKIIEEAPAPGVRDEVRLAMAQAAVQAARTVGYVGAGTVEFLLDPDQQFYFMEMNTRLQVEHPVTELITGIDLVEWQLRIAQGENLPRRQHEIVGRGVAIEARLYAEDPAHGYLPSVGKITHLHWPEPAEGLRVDSGVDAGDEVSPFYDPMLGKVIAWSETRNAAIDRLSRAMDEIEIAGVTTNRALLAGVLADSVFREGAVATDFLELRRPHLSFGEALITDEDAILGALWYATCDVDGGALWNDSSGWRLSAPAITTWRFADRLVSIERIDPAGYLGRCGPLEIPLQLISRDAQLMRVELGLQICTLKVRKVNQSLQLIRHGDTQPSRHCIMRLTSTEDALLSSEGEDQGSLVTPLPGTIVAVHVSAGQHVLQGDALVTVEAMKMEHTLTAPHDGIVARIPFAVADRVAAGAILIELSTSAIVQTT